MNIFTTIVLSSKKQAIAGVARESARPLVIWQHIFAYALKVTKNGDDTFDLGIYRVTYPDTQEEKWAGKPHVAAEAHFSQTFTREELVNFLTVSGFSDDGWFPVEDDMEDVKLL